MLEFLKALKEQDKSLYGYAALFLIPGSMLVAISKLSEEGWYNKYAIFAALLFFTFGVLTVLVQLFLPFFAQRPAKGAFDGATAGFFAGLIGGFLGYGSHVYDFHVCLDPHLYDDSSLLRMAYCVAFAVPVGAVMGAAVDTFVSSNAERLRKNFTRFFLVMLVIVTLTTALVAALLPELRLGISGGDLLILLSLFCVFLLGIISLSDGLGTKHLVACTLSVLSASVITAFLLARTRIVDSFSIYEELGAEDGCFTSILDYQFTSSLDFNSLIQGRLPELTGFDVTDQLITMALIFGGQLWVFCVCGLSIWISQYLTGPTDDVRH